MLRSYFLVYKAYSYLEYKTKVPNIILIESLAASSFGFCPGSDSKEESLSFLQIITSL